NNPVPEAFATLSTLWKRPRGFTGTLGYSQSVRFQGSGTVAADVPGETPAATVVEAGRASLKLYHYRFQHDLFALGLAVLVGGAFLFIPESRAQSPYAQWTHG